MSDYIKLEFTTTELVRQICDSCTDNEIEDLLAEVINYRNSKSVADKIVGRIDCYGI